MMACERLVALLSGLVLTLTITPCWGAPPNSTPSDVNDNTAGGTNALVNVNETASGGFDNTAFGHDALFANTTGGENTGVGDRALGFNTTGALNTAIGSATLLNNTSGFDNTAAGSEGLASNTTGSENTATGVSALFGNTTGNLNTAAGFQALLDNTAGLENVAVGAKALKKSTGNKNIGIGYQAGVTLTIGNNNIYIGNQGGGDESQTIRIGTAQTQTFIAGIAMANVSGASVEVDPATGQLGIASFSSARYKRDIAPMGSRSEGVFQLRPVTFAYKDDAAGVTHYGLIAEEVAVVFPELVGRNATGEVQTVRYQELIPILLNELQRQHEELAEVAILRKELAELRAAVGSRQGQQAASSWHFGVVADSAP